MSGAKRFRTRVLDRTTPIRTAVEFDRAEYQEDLEASQLDRLEIQESTNSLVDESSRVDARVRALGPLECASYIHIRADSPSPRAIDSLSQFNARISSDDVEMTIEFDTPIGAPYTATVSNQQNSSNVMFWTQNRLSNSVDIRATDLVGNPINMSGLVLELVLICRRLLPENY